MFFENGMLIPCFSGYTSCTCGMGESREMGEVNAFWDECNEVDTSTVQPIQSAECLRQRCVSCIYHAVNEYV